MYVLICALIHDPTSPPPPRRPDYVHIMEAGKIVKTGGWEIVQGLEKEGYASVNA